MSVHCSLVVTYQEMIYLLALSYMMFSCVFVTFQCGVLCQVWYLIVSIPDLCIFPYFEESIQSSTTPDLGYQRHNKTSQTRAKRPAPSPAGDHKTSTNKMHESITKQDRNNINDPQKKHRLGTISKNILLYGPNRSNSTPK